MDGLSAEKEKFCQHYALHFNGAAAYRDCISKSKKLKPQALAERASRLLADCKISARISELRARVIAEAEKKFDISIHRCLDEYARMGLANMDDFVTKRDDGTAFLDLTKVTRDHMAAVQEMTFETVMSSDPDVLEASGKSWDGEGRPPRVKVLKTKFKLHDKKGPLDSIMKHLGGFEKDNKQKGEAEAEALKAAAAPDRRDLARAIIDILRSGQTTE